MYGHHAEEVMNGYVNAIRSCGKTPFSFSVLVMHSLCSWVRALERYPDMISQNHTLEARQSDVFMSSYRVVGSVWF